MPAWIDYDHPLRGMSSRQRRALELLYRNGPLSDWELARRLDCPYRSVLPMLERINVRSRFIERDMGDGRLWLERAMYERESGRPHSPETLAAVRGTWDGVVRSGAR